MKCFHFTNGQRRDDEGVSVSRSSKVSWARSFSVASSSVDTRRSEFESESRDFGDSVAFHELLSLRRANDLRVFSFAELKSATRGFSRALLIGEGGFGCVFRGVVSVDGSDSKMDVAVKQLDRSGFQACHLFPLFSMPLCTSECSVLYKSKLASDFNTFQQKKKKKKRKLACDRCVDSVRLNVRAALEILPFSVFFFSTVACQRSNMRVT